MESEKPHDECLFLFSQKKLSYKNNYQITFSSPRISRQIEDLPYQTVIINPQNPNKSQYLVYNKDAKFDKVLTYIGLHTTTFGLLLVNLAGALREHATYITIHAHQYQLTFSHGCFI